MLELTPGTILESRYKILGPLGRGGMGAVYLAEDSRLNCLCAVKIALRTDPEARAQFQREAGFLANLHHYTAPVGRSLSDFDEHPWSELGSA